MAKRGRPPKLDDIKKREICALASAGMHRLIAVEQLGCSRQTFYNTIERDAKFREDLDRAELAYHLRHLRNIDRHAEKSWRASAWALSRRYTDRYAERSADTVTLLEFEVLSHALADLTIRFVPEENRDAYEEAFKETFDMWKERRGQIKKRMSTPKGRRIAAELAKAGPLTPTRSEDADHDWDGEHNQHRTGRD